MRRKVLGTVCCLAVCLILGQNQGLCASAGAFAEHYNAAQSYLMQNQYSSSIVEFRKALRINYLDNSARIGLINAYLARATYYANQENLFIVQPVAMYAGNFICGNGRRQVVTFPCN